MPKPPKPTDFAAIIVTVALMAFAPASLAQDGHAGHSGHSMDAQPGMPSGHEGHMGQMQAEPGQEAAGVGVVNSVDAGKGTFNITHEPMPALGWPSMTMDLPVMKKVDLSGVKAGDKIGFTLKLGRDKQYRVIDVKPAP